MGRDSYILAEVVVNLEKTNRMLILMLQVVLQGRYSKAFSLEQIEQLIGSLKAEEIINKEKL